MAADRKSVGVQMIAIADGQFWVLYREANAWDEYASALHLDEFAESIEEARTLMEEKAKSSLPAGTAYVFRIFEMSLIDEQIGCAKE
jgi:hypothetical protein